MLPSKRNPHSLQLEISPHSLQPEKSPGEAAKTQCSQKLKKKKKSNGYIKLASQHFTFCLADLLLTAHQIQQFRTDSMGSTQRLKGRSPQKQGQVGITEETGRILIVSADFEEFFSYLLTLKKKG